MGAHTMADAFDPTPRVNQQLLGQYVGRSVRLVGKVLNMDHQNMVLESSDHAQVKVNFPAQITGVEGSTFVEVIGKVNQDLSVRGTVALPFGDNFDLDNHNEL